MRHSLRLLHEAALLRIPNTNSLYDPRELAKIALQLQPEDAYPLYCLLDAWRHVQRPLVGIDEATYASSVSSVNHITLPMQIRRAVGEASYLSDVAMVRDALIRLICKVLNARCQGRKYGTVAQFALFPSATHSTRYAAIKQRWASDPKKKDPRDVRFVTTYLEFYSRRVLLLRMVLQALLGNFPHCRTHVTSLKARHLLYEVFTDTRTAATRSARLRFLQALLHQRGGEDVSLIGGAPLMVWCIRECVVHCVLDDSALRAQIGELVHFDAFRKLVGEVMAVVRCYIDQNLPNSWSSLGTCVRETLVPTNEQPLCTCLDKGKRKTRCLYSKGRQWRWLHHLAVLLEPYKVSMLAIQYHKPKIDAVSWLVSSDVRKAAPLVPRRLSPEEEAERADAAATYREEDEEAEDKLYEMLYKRIRGGTLTVKQMEQISARSRELLRQKKEEQDARARDKEVMQNALLFLTKVQFDLLYQTVRTLLPGGLAAVVDAWRDMPGLGANNDLVVDGILLLLESHRVSSSAKLAQRRQLVELQSREPHAYNLLQIAAELIKHPGDDGRVVGRFCIETLQAQIEACSQKTLRALLHLQTSKLAQLERAKTQDPPPPGLEEAKEACLAEMARIRAEWRPAMDRHSTSLLVCPVCTTVYSNVRTSDPRAKFYQYGLMKALRDYSAPEHAFATYCRNDVVNHRGSCHGQLLERIPLLGIRYAFGKRVYQLCVGCGDICSLEHGVLMAESDKGTLCSFCTKRVRDERSRISPTRLWVQALDRKCVCCGARTTTPQSTYLYPHRVCLCAHCHSPYVQTKIAARFWATPTELIAELVRMHVVWKALKRERAQPLATRKMQLARRRNNSKRA